MSLIPTYDDIVLVYLYFKVWSIDGPAIDRTPYFPVWARAATRTWSKKNREILRPEGHTRIRT